MVKTSYAYCMVHRTAISQYSENTAILEKERKIPGQTTIFRGNTQHRQFKVNAGFPGPTMKFQDAQSTGT